MTSPAQYWDNPQMKWVRVAIAQMGAAADYSPRAMYAALEMYYWNNGLYDAIMQRAYTDGIWVEGMKGLRNPAHRVVEFYPAKLWPGQLPGALPIVGAKPAVIKAIHKIWDWSNWGVQKQLAARWFALFGDWFCKIATRKDASERPTRVFFQQIKPEHVTDFETDERGFLVYTRFDIPQVQANGQQVKQVYHTEIWDKSQNSYRVWKHDRGPDTPLQLLGPALVEKPITGYGFDFIPVVHAKFTDMGDKRGAGVFVHALDKIDEANRMATRLHQILFRYNRPLWSLEANSIDASGRPLPAPSLGAIEAGENDGTLELGDDTLLRLPGMSKLGALVPQLDYSGALAILAAQMVELEQDLPELAYYRLKERTGEISGRAVRLLMSDVIDRAKEARGNLETALARANAMALTVGANAGLQGFTGIGSYDAGDFAHTFAERDIIALSELEQAEVVQKEVQAGIPLVTSLRDLGKTEEWLAQMLKDQEEAQSRQQAGMGEALLQALRNMDQGAGANIPSNGNQQLQEQ